MSIHCGTYIEMQIFLILHHRVKICIHKSGDFFLQINPNLTFWRSCMPNFYGMVFSLTIMSNKHVCIYSPMSPSSYFRRRHAERALSTVHKDTRTKKKSHRYWNRTYGRGHVIHIWTDPVALCSMSAKKKYSNDSFLSCHNGNSSIFMTLASKGNIVKSTKSFEAHKFEQNTNV